MTLDVLADDNKGGNDLDARDLSEALGTSAAVAAALFGSKLYKTYDAVVLFDQANGGSLRKLGIETAVFAFALLLTVALGKPHLRRPAFRVALLTIGGFVALMPLLTFLLNKGGLAHLPVIRMFGSVEHGLCIFRGDVGLAAAFCGLLLGTQTWARKSWRRPLLRGLQFIAFVLVVSSALEVMYFISTGTPGDGFLLRYWYTNFSNVAFIVSNELHLRNCLLLGVALAFVPLAAWLSRRTLAFSTIKPLSLRSAAPVLLVAGLMFGFSPGVPPDQFLYAKVAPQFQVSSVIDLMGDPYWAVVGKGGLASASLPPLGDTRALKFAASPRTKPLNVVLIILESTRARSVTPYNPELSNTPFLADLARRSLKVEDMHSVIAATARAWTAILTGLYPVTSSVSVWSDAESSGQSLASLPKLLRPHGYRSAFFTPSHLLFEHDASLINNRGFDSVNSDGSYDTRGFERSTYFGFEDRIMLKPSLSWIDRARAEGKPFFVTYMTLTGHHDYKTPSTFVKTHYCDQTDLNDYLNALGYIDGWLHDLFAAFEQRGMLDSTMFIVLGDHGESFGEHGSRQHLGIMYEEALHIPALVYAPALGLKPGLIQGPRQQIDILPTVADALGFDLRDGFVPGVSLLRDVPADRQLYFSSWQENVALAKTQNHRKYVYAFRRLPTQVFDLLADPLEQHDLGSNLSAGQAEDIERDLLQWRQRSVDVFLSRK